MARNRTAKILLLSTCCAGLMTGAASASIIINRSPVDFSGGAVSIGYGPGFGTGDITFSDNKSSPFDGSPVSVATSAAGAVTYSAFFGTPDIFFDAIRGSGSLTFGPATPFSSLLDPTIIRYSATPSIIGLADTSTDGIHYGYGEFDGTSLVSYGFESVAGKAITITNTTLSAVPLPASAPMFGAAVLAVGLVGYAAKRNRAATTA